MPDRELEQADFGARQVPLADTSFAASRAAMI
jgi:hypothetical protein